MGSVISPILPRSLHPFPRELSFPKELMCFAGEPSAEIPPDSSCERMDTLFKAHFSSTRAMAKHLYNSDLSYQTNETVTRKVHLAAIDFFTLLFKQLSDEEQYPLAGHNKCLGMAIVPGTKLVLIALSEARNPDSDKPLRKKFLQLITKINLATRQWVFELVATPMMSEYLILRTLSMKEPHRAPKEWLEPRTRCAEVALAVALCKAGRFKEFAPKDVGIATFGANLWASEKEDIPINYFEGSLRNRKHITKVPLQVPLDKGQLGWLDIWDPCAEHCRIDERAMIALSASGGKATSFIGPRSENFLYMLS